MGLDTVATHLAGLGETHARTAEYESSTRRRDTLLPYEAEKKSLDIKTSKLILSELLKDEAYNDLVRQNKITTAQSVSDWHDSVGPKGLVAEILLAKEAEEFKNRTDLMVSKNDLVLNQYSVLHGMADKHFSSLGDPNYDSSAGINQLESMWEIFTQKMVEAGIATQRPRIDKETGQPTEEMIWTVGLLPGGRSQNDPITGEDFAGNMTDHLEIMEIMSQKGTAMLQTKATQEGADRRARMTGDKAPGPTSVTETGAVSGHMLKALQGVLPEGFAVDDATGKVTVAPGYGGSVQTINDWATAAVTGAMDKNPNANIAGIENQVAKHIGNNIQPYQAEAKTWLGMGGGDDPHTYNTFVPTEKSAKRQGMTQAEYIQRLEATIEEEKGRRDAQSIADEVFRNNFSNMVTASP